MGRADLREPDGLILTFLDWGLIGVIHEKVFCGEIHSVNQGQFVVKARSSFQIEPEKFEKTYCTEVGHCYISRPLPKKKWINH